MVSTKARSIHYHTDTEWFWHDFQANPPSACWSVSSPCCSGSSAWSTPYHIWMQTHATSRIRLGKIDKDRNYKVEDMEPGFWLVWFFCSSGFRFGKVYWKPTKEIKSSKPLSLVTRPCKSMSHCWETSNPNLPDSSYNFEIQKTKLNHPNDCHGTI